MTLQEYIEQEILPRYADFDKGHQRDHAESVISPGTWGKQRDGIYHCCFS